MAINMSIRLRLTSLLLGTLVGCSAASSSHSAATSSSTAISGADLFSALNDYTVNGIKVGATGAVTDIGKLPISTIYAKLAGDSASLKGQAAAFADLDKAYPNFAAYLQAAGYSSESMTAAGLQKGLDEMNSAKSASLGLDDGMDSNTDSDNNGAATAQTTAQPTAGGQVGANNQTDQTPDELAQEEKAAKCAEAKSRKTGFAIDAGVTVASVGACMFNLVKMKIWGVGICSVAAWNLGNTMLGTMSSRYTTPVARASQGAGTQIIADIGKYCN